MSPPSGQAECALKKAGYPHLEKMKWDNMDVQKITCHWLERAWKYGLRLAVMFLVRNTVLCELFVAWGSEAKAIFRGDHFVKPGKACTVEYTVRKQLEWLRALIKWVKRYDPSGFRDGWIEIVKTPAQARRAIARGKLAIVLGLEVDEPFGCKDCAECTPQKISSGLAYLHNHQDVRHIFPVHGLTNGLGGSALFREVYNGAHNLRHGGKRYMDLACAPKSANIHWKLLGKAGLHIEMGLAGLALGVFRGY